jgi:hypothetical protein
VYEVPSARISQTSLILADSTGKYVLHDGLLALPTSPTTLRRQARIRQSSSLRQSRYSWKVNH